MKIPQEDKKFSRLSSNIYDDTGQVRCGHRPDKVWPEVGFFKSHCVSCDFIRGELKVGGRKKKSANKG